MASDLHAHWIPPALADALRARTGGVPRIERAAGGERLVMPIGSLAFNDSYVDPQRRLAFMDRVGVRRQLLSLPGLFGVDSLPLAEAAPLVREFNDATAELCRRHPDRFAGLAALPLADIDQALAEFRRARQQLGLLGAILPVDAFASVEQARRLAPLLQAGDTLGAHFFIHPGRRPDSGPLPPVPPDNDLHRRALAVQHEVGEAMVTLLLSDVLAPYRNISVQVANLGGTFPAVLERMDHTIATRQPGMPLPSSRSCPVLLDCSSLGPRTLRLAAATFGVERIVLGTDCPIFDTEWTLRAVREAGLSAAEQELVLGKNARRVLPL
ncbi:MAG TPA: amidohydrolase family protein [Ramlibacter sp.]|nr:amidohydrolase family protein [Ramlibacter sp.]